MNKLDAGERVDAEIHRKALQNAADEMAITLMRTSGSPVVTDAKDFSTCILGPDNHQVAFSGYVSAHISTSFLGVEAVLERFNREEIEPGDGFFCNDPHSSGALHQGDLGIVMPFFLDETLRGWTYTNEHLLDVGGSAVSGFAPEATDCYSEAPRYSALKVIQDYRIDEEWERFLSDNVRAPIPVLNDVRSMLAAHEKGRDRIRAIVEKWGLDRHQRLNRVNRELCEEAVRERIRDLPDGTYFSRDWLEQDVPGEPRLLEVRCRLLVEDDEMTVQLRGESQTSTYINGVRPAMLGHAMTSLLCVFMPGIPVNGGIWEPFHFDLGPPGTVVNASPPAPVSASHMECGMRINRMMVDGLSQAMELSDEPSLRSRVAGLPNNGVTSFTASGVYRDSGEPFVVFPIAMTVGLGGGAQTVHDGLDTYSTQINLGVGMPDVEVEESSTPLMVLWRRLNENSGGAGVHRGGLGMSCALLLVESDCLSGSGFSTITDIPPKGMFGGYPGAVSDWFRLVRNNARELLEQGRVPDSSNLEGARQESPAKTSEFILESGDVYRVQTGGGGGLGDPLLRDPQHVRGDVRDGYVSDDVARDQYGVVLDDQNQVAEGRTRERRRQLRSSRIEASPVHVRSIDDAWRTLTASDGHWTCGICSEQLGPLKNNWRLQTVHECKPTIQYLRELNLRAREQEGPRVMLERFYCPNCGVLLQADIGRENDPISRSPALGTLIPFQRETGPAEDQTPPGES